MEGLLPCLFRDLSILCKSARLSLTWKLIGLANALPPASCRGRHYVAGPDGCWGEERKYQAATMANKVAVIVKGVECNRMKLIILSRSIMVITSMMSITVCNNFIRARIALP